MSGEQLSNLAASACAGTIARAICHPIDTCKAKLQSGTTFKGAFDVVKSTYKIEGMRGFYQGIGAVMFGGVPGVCVYMSTYEASKSSLQKVPLLNSHPFISYFISGMVAETVCCAMFVPVDVIKERLQVQSNRADNHYKGSIDALKTILKEEGTRGLYKGYFATLSSYGPFSALYFLIYEESKKLVESTKSYNKTQLSFKDNLICSAFAGSIASFVTNPLDLAKLRFQIQRNTINNNSNGKTNKISFTSTAFKFPTPTTSISAPARIVLPEDGTRYTGLWDTLYKLYHQHGIRGLFRGAGTRVLFFTPSTAITMALYEEFKTFFSQRQ